MSAKDRTMAELRLRRLRKQATDIAGPMGSMAGRLGPLDEYGRAAFAVSRAAWDLKAELGRRMAANRAADPLTLKTQP